MHWQQTNKQMKVDKWWNIPVWWWRMDLERFACLETKTSNNTNVEHIECNTINMKTFSYKSFYNWTSLFSYLSIEKTLNNPTSALFCSSEERKHKHCQSYTRSGWHFGSVLRQYFPQIWIFINCISDNSSALFHWWSQVLCLATSIQK